MSKASQPELKKFMDKRLSISLQGGRKVSGVLRGFDIFLNLVVDDATEESGHTASAPPTKLPLGQIVIRGNSVTSMETLER
ncbi:like-Sm ribonucleoprotein [Clavulina sp. PMI_390]|nr:like-Sm ribonucleoprotein [Clavulina sp. PMI_390]